MLLEISAPIPRIFPNIRPHLMLLRLQFLFPFPRDLFLKGHALVIVLGGVPEMHATRNETMIFNINRRKGFVRLALKYGYVYNNRRKFL
jgi:hypothetical protein